MAFSVDINRLVLTRLSGISRTKFGVDVLRSLTSNNFYVLFTYFEFIPKVNIFSGKMRNFITIYVLVPKKIIYCYIFKYFRNNLSKCYFLLFSGSKELKGKLTMSEIDFHRSVYVILYTVLKCMYVCIYENTVQILSQGVCSFSIKEVFFGKTFVGTHYIIPWGIFN